MPRARPHAVELETAAKRRSAPRACDHCGCAAAGDFRAPRSRDSLTEYFWFCLDHVRAYNRTWDYYRGMSPEQIERERRRDTVGQRPSWPMGSRGSNGMPQTQVRGIDRDALEAAFRRLLGDEEAESRRLRPLTPEEEAFKVLDLAPGAAIDAVKARYKVLVKLHHPDANGGDKAAEERLKSINQAYTFLKSQAFGARQAPSR